MRLVDSHAHLDDPRFAEDLPEVIDRAARAGVECILTIGCLRPEEDSRDRVLRLLERWDHLYAAFGVHPHDARFLDDALAGELERLLEHPRVVGLGEIGLDFYYDNSPREAQSEAFKRQLEIARRFGKPVIIHTRDAEAETVEILSGWGVPAGERPGLLHCFTGSRELAEAGLRLGFSLAFGGVLTFKKADELRAIAASVPPDRVLLETDCPYLAPVPHRGRRNEPAFLAEAARVLASCRGTEVETVAEETTRNFRSLFGIADWDGLSGVADPA